MSRNYYCLIAGLPDILLEDKKTGQFLNGYRQLLSESLHPDDLKLISLLYLPFDHKNIVSVYFKQNTPFDNRANYNLEDVEILIDKRRIELNEPSVFPNYINEVVESVITSDEPTSPNILEFLLSKAYWNYLSTNKNKFIKRLAEYEITQRNVFTALNTRKHNINVNNQLVGDNEITEALIRSKSRDFGLAGEIDNIEQMILIFENDNLLERELKIDTLKWQFIDDSTFFNYFSIEKLLGFTAKLLLVERWIGLEHESGQMLFAKLLNDLKTEFKIPEDYTLNHGKNK